MWHCAFYACLAEIVNGILRHQFEYAVHIFVAHHSEYDTECIAFLLFELLGSIGNTTHIMSCVTYYSRGVMNDLPSSSQSCIMCYMHKSVLDVLFADMVTLLDKLLVISLIGAAVDVLPWFFYDLSDTDQKAIVRVLRLRTAIEDKAAGVLQDDVYCEACEALQAMRANLAQEKEANVRKHDVSSSKERRTANKQIRQHNEEIDIAQFLQRELHRYTSPFGEALIDLCRKMVQDGAQADELEKLAVTLPQGGRREDRALRSDAIHMARAVKRSEALLAKYPETKNALSADEYELLYGLPEDTKEQRREKRTLLRAANRERNRCGKVMKPVLWAQRNLLLCEAYANLESFEADYPQAQQRLEEAHRAAAQKAAALIPI